jgi:hypothetical protein
MPSFRLGIHEFRWAKTVLSQANSWMARPSLALTTEKVMRAAQTRHHCRSRRPHVTHAAPARVVELVDTRDLKSLGPKGLCRFESGRGHQLVGYSRMPSSPISEAQIWDELNSAWPQMGIRQQRLWEIIRVAPEKWRLHSHSDTLSGFWAVGIIGRNVIWYNQAEGCFMRSAYQTSGIIAEASGHAGNLHDVVQGLLKTIEGDALS